MNTYRVDFYTVISNLFQQTVPIFDIEAADVESAREAGKIALAAKISEWPYVIKSSEVILVSPAV